MQIYVSSAGAAISPQIRAYAEYRIFAVLARYDDVRRARVVLRDEADGRLKCSVAVDFFDRASLRASAKGTHTAVTVDAAAERVAGLMRRTLHPEIAAASH
jgi:ribosome-associated translation inhibitor RaiA